MGLITVRYTKLLRGAGFVHINVYQVIAEEKVGKLFMLILSLYADRYKTGP